jgi:hypothetical protein
LAEGASIGACYLPGDKGISSRRKIRPSRADATSGCICASEYCRGFKRRGQADKMRFYNTSETSLEELKYYFTLSGDLEYITDTEQLIADAETVSRMLYRLIESINSRR